MGKISRLPSDLANQIAAGEVVERPASVVKELVENALDAGATRVRVDVDHGGLTRIRVTDDGEGMDPADAQLALERHATSKIRSIADLTRIATFGFRGEALPSIASIARVTLTTRTAASPEGVEVTIEGGGETKARPAGCAVGTSVEVKDLFFNVPARRKFLKSQGTEAAHVGEVVLLAALARPDVTFVLARDGKVAREYLRAATRKERVIRAIGEDRLEECTGARGPMTLEAHLAAPERARAGAVALHLFVNGRPVKDRSLARAVAQAYGSVMEAGRYPVGAVYIELPPEGVDVNVHPQKAEVRFAEGRALYDSVTRELHLALARAFNVPALGARNYWPTSDKQLPMQSPPRTQPDTRSISEAHGGPTSDAEGQISVTMRESVAPYSSEPSTLRSLPSTSPPPLFSAAGFYGRLTFLAQVRATFLLCEGDDGLYVLDQHAAAERVTFDRLRRAYTSRSVAMQKLLVPEVIELLPAEIAAIEEAEEQLLGLGVELRAAGASSVAVHAVPKILSRARPERIVRDLVAELSHAAKRPFGDAADLVLATMACHGSVRAGDALSREEAVALLRALDDVDFAGHCPHGRPVVTRTSFEELERRVGR